MAPSPVQQAKVKSALSGDTLILTSVTASGQERTLSLAFVSAPRMRREGDEVSGASPCEWILETLLMKASSHLGSLRETS